MLNIYIYKRKPVTPMTGSDHMPFYYIEMNSFILYEVK